MWRRRRHARSRRGALLIRGLPALGPESAKHRFALRRVRDTSPLSPKYSTNNDAYFEMASDLDAR
jgi:hypothetical protein